MATPTSLPATFVAGNVLTAAQMNDLRGAFRILQVVRATDSTARTTSSTGFQDANISVTITPTSATSTILVIWSYSVATTGTFAARYSRQQITDSSNNALSGAEFMVNGVQGADSSNFITAIGYDAPATTSATTYKGRFNVNNANNTCELKNDTNTGQLYALEISA